MWNNHPAPRPIWHPGIRRFLFWYDSIHMTTITVTPDPLQAGGTASVSITGGTGPTATVKIDDGGDPPQTDTLEITLNDEGDGARDWNVPADWPVANFNAEGALEVSVLVTRPGDAAGNEAEAMAAADATRNLLETGDEPPNPKRGDVWDDRRAGFRKKWNGAQWVAFEKLEGSPTGDEG